ncbi:MAG: phage tail tube protein, partial [Lactobacillus sp.]|nr:phage tail tube protein [Lactobacillus sp.]
MADESTSTIGSYLNGRDTISTKDAKVYITINGKVIPLIECNELSLKLEKNKEDVQT